MPRVVLPSGLVCGLVVLVVGTGCNRLPVPGGAQGAKPDAARKHAHSQAINAVHAAAKAQAELLAQSGISFTKPASNRATSPVSVKIRSERSDPPTPPTNSSGPVPSGGSNQPITAKPRPRATPILSEMVVSSIPYLNEGEAEEDALNLARDLIERRLAELDSPLQYRPSINEVKTEFIRPDSRTFILLRDVDSKEFPSAVSLREELAKRYSPDEIARLGYVRYQVEVSASQVRELRTRDRLGTSLRMLVVISFAALLGYLFLQADEWTKGYLTRWLAFIAMLLAGGAAAALYFV